MAIFLDILKYLRHVTALPIESALENKSTAMCDCLAASGALPTLDRRRAEDELADSVYTDVPAPERQLLAFVHVMLSRGLWAEGELTEITSLRDRRVI